jgi:hypothetical protein
VIPTELRLETGVQKHEVRMNTLRHTAKVNEIECILVAYQFRCLCNRIRVFRILVDMSTPARHHQPRICCVIVRTGATTTSHKRTHQFGGTLFGRAVSFLSCQYIGKRLLYTPSWLKWATRGIDQLMPRDRHMEPQSYIDLPEINAQNLGGRVHVRHIDGPYTSTSSDVKYSLWVAQRCFMQLSS